MHSPVKKLLKVGWTPAKPMAQWKNAVRRVGLGSVGHATVLGRHLLCIGTKVDALRDTVQRRIRLSTSALNISGAELLIATRHRRSSTEQSVHWAST